MWFLKSGFNSGAALKNFKSVVSPRAQQNQSRNTALTNKADRESL